MAKETKVLVDASSRIFYTSFYLKGLYDVFGKKNVSFSNNDFKMLMRDSEEFSFEHYFAFILILTDTRKIKIIIDFCDPTDINESAYLWCDFYAKINFNSTEIDQKFKEKTVIIPPGFGIKIWNLWETIYHCFSNLVKCKFNPIVSLKRFIEDYYLQYRSVYLSEYQNKKSLEKKEPYVFMIATLWHENDEKTNQKRKAFIEALKIKNCNFEGGFFAEESHPKKKEYNDFLITKPYSREMYIEKTRLSNFVFNTPAVHNCHGWKLAEYFAMGKAIISTPLSNEMPVQLEHGTTIHIVSNGDELTSGILLLLNDKKYRAKLSENATDYYDKVIHPKAVIQTILSRIPASICIPK